MGDDIARERLYEFAAGYIVLRFTGSQLHRDAFECADETMGCILQTVVRQWPGGKVPLPTEDDE